MKKEIVNKILLSLAVGRFWIGNQAPFSAEEVQETIEGELLTFIEKETGTPYAELEAQVEGMVDEVPDYISGESNDSD
jgi:hypothetical protein